MLFASVDTEFPRICKASKHGFEAAAHPQNGFELEFAHSCTVLCRNESIQAQKRRRTRGLAQSNTCPAWKCRLHHCHHKHCRPEKISQQIISCDLLPDNYWDKFQVHEVVIHYFFLTCTWERRNHRLSGWSSNLVFLDRLVSGEWARRINLVMILVTMVSRLHLRVASKLECWDLQNQRRQTTKQWHNNTEGLEPSLAHDKMRHETYSSSFGLFIHSTDIKEEQTSQDPGRVKPLPVRSISLFTDLPALQELREAK